MDSMTGRGPVSHRCLTFSHDTFEYPCPMHVRCSCMVKLSYVSRTSAAGLVRTRALVPMLACWGEWMFMPVDTWSTVVDRCKATAHYAASSYPPRSSVHIAVVPIAVAYTGAVERSEEAHKKKRRKSERANATRSYLTLAKFPRAFAGVLYRDGLDNH